MNSRFFAIAGTAVALLSAACTQNAPVPATPVGGGPVANATLPAGVGGATGGGPATPERGKALVTEKGCVACHIIKDVPGAVGTIGPALDGVGDPAKRAKIADNRMDNTPANMRRWLQNPPAIKPGTQMPNLGLAAGELDSLVAFLSTLK